jgi:hypothetical protein
MENVIVIRDIMMTVKKIKIVKNAIINVKNVRMKMNVFNVKVIFVQILVMENVNAIKGILMIIRIIQIV